MTAALYIALEMFQMFCVGFAALGVGVAALTWAQRK